MKTLSPTEHGEQSAFIAWCKLMEPQIPELALIFAIPNGGFRHWKTAAYLKAEGTKAGVPDLFLPVYVRSFLTYLSPYVPNFRRRRCGQYGLFIEFKRPGGPKPTESQLWWHDRLRGEGYCVEVCYGFEEAKAAVLRYLGGGIDETLDPENSPTDEAVG